MKKKRKPSNWEFMVHFVQRDKNATFHIAYHQKAVDDNINFSLYLEPRLTRQMKHSTFIGKRTIWEKNVCNDSASITLKTTILI